LPFLGVGIGFRREIESQILAHRSSIDWLEVISEHYMGQSPERNAHAQRLRKVFPLIPHGIEMSIGTDGELDATYIGSLAEFVKTIQAAWFSDHLCFTRAGNIALGQLVPLQRTRAIAAHVSRKAQFLQSEIGIPFLLENITYYIDLKEELSESEFILEIMNQCECGLLLDLTNVYINSTNHNFDPLKFLDNIPMERVVQVHLAGGKKSPTAFLDTHGAPVHKEVFELLRYTVPRAPNLKGVLVERDQDYPSDFTELLNDLETARKIAVLQPVM